MRFGNSIIDAYIIWFIKLSQNRFRGELCEEAVTGGPADLLAIMGKRSFYTQHIAQYV